jgi:hypothetical protein
MASKNNSNVFEMRTPHLGLFLAKRNSGKSYLMRYLLLQLTKAKRFSWVFVISPTAIYNKEWDLVGEDHVSGEFNSDWVLALMTSMGKMRMKDPTYEGLLILDDCLASVRLDDPVLKQLYLGGRHYGITVWVSSQHLQTRATTMLRSNVDYCFSFKQPDKSIESMQAEYNPVGIDSWKDLKLRLQAATGDFGCLCIDNLNDGATHIIRAPANETNYILNISKRKLKKSHKITSS